MDHTFPSDNEEDAAAAAVAATALVSATSVGDIWSTGAFSFESPLKDLLDSGTYSVNELLEQDELLQELRGMHPTLVEFFSSDEAVQELVYHVIRQPQQQQATRLNGSHVFNLEQVRQNDFNLLFLRYPYMACEVLCSEINGIIDALVDGIYSRPADSPEEEDASITTLLDLLFSLLYRTKPGQLDDYRAGYFDKILSVLCRRKPEELTQYVNQGGPRGRLSLMQVMISHLYSHSILQIVQRFLLPLPPPMPMPPQPQQQNVSDPDLMMMNRGDPDDEPEPPIFQCKWSESPESISLLLESLFAETKQVPDVNRLAVAQNASEVLITTIQHSSLSSQTMLTMTTDPICDRIMRGACTLPIRSTEGINGNLNQKHCQDFSPHDSILTCCMNVLESLVLQLGGYGSVPTIVDDEAENGVEYASADIIEDHLPFLLENLNSLLKHPSAQNWVSQFQFERINNDDRRLGLQPAFLPILGVSRLRIVRLIESLVLLGNPNVDQILCQSDCLQTCMDLFWQFEWNSMLHQSVANLLVHAFEGANARACLQEYFINKTDLLERLMNAFSDDDEDRISGSVSGDEDGGIKDALNRLSISHQDDEPDNSNLSNDSNAADYAHDDDVLPVSDDDVDAALEQEQSIREEAAAAAAEQDGDDNDCNSDRRDGMTEKMSSSRSLDLLQDILRKAPSPPDLDARVPALRKGFMGHVIIVCQALVQACSGQDHSSTLDFEQSANFPPPSAESSPAPRPRMPDADQFDEIRNQRRAGGDFNEDDEENEPNISSQQDNTNDFVQDEELEGEPLILASLVISHPSRDRWHDFITTTLATETNIQSTPLGGFNASTATLDPMRPGIMPGLNDFNEDYNTQGGNDGDAREVDEDAMPVDRESGLTIGAVFDAFDDNDIEIAASMMDAYATGNPSFTTDLPPPKAGNDYVFDDPLGGDNQQFNANRSGGDSSDDDDEEGEEEVEDGNIDPDRTLDRQFSSGSGDGDPPVLDLFAGNFGFDNANNNAGPENSNSDKAKPEGSKQNGVLVNGGDWSNFANFDNAFTPGSPKAVDEKSDPFEKFQQFSEAQQDSPKEESFFNETEGNSSRNIDDIFGSESHELLLEDDRCANDTGTNTTSENDDNQKQAEKGQETGDRDEEGSHSSDEDGDSRQQENELNVVQVTDNASSRIETEDQGDVSEVKALPEKTQPEVLVTDPENAAPESHPQNCPVETPAN